MNPTETDYKFIFRSRWIYCLALLAISVLLPVIAMPFVQNYRAIKYFQSQDSRMLKESGALLNSLPQYWQNWLYKTLGKDRLLAFETVTCLELQDKLKGEIDFSHLSQFHDLNTLYIYHRHVTDDDLVHFSNLKKLEILYLNEKPITDAGLIHLKGLTQLKDLFLSDTQVGDIGLSHIKDLKNLEWLELENTQVSDAGINYLKRFTKLEQLYIQYKTGVTNKGMKELKLALPKCDIK